MPKPHSVSAILFNKTPKAPSLEYERIKSTSAQFPSFYNSTSVKIFQMPLHRVLMYIVPYTDSKQPVGQLIQSDHVTPQLLPFLALNHPQTMYITVFPTDLAFAISPLNKTLFLTIYSPWRSKSNA